MEVKVQACGPILTVVLLVLTTFMLTYFLVPVLHVHAVGTGIFIIIQPRVNLFNSSKIVFDSLNVHLHLV